MAGRERGTTIAVVDDEEAVLQVARAMLELAGYRVLTAANGAEAVELACQEGGAVSLMLLDVAMPVMGGIEAIPLIRQASPALVIAVMTGLGDQTTLDRVSALGIELIEKPFRADQLAARVGTLLQARR
jgi:CheY-like chemotaxis protein